MDALSTGHTYANEKPLRLAIGRAGMANDFPVWSDPEKMRYSVRMKRLVVLMAMLTWFPFATKAFAEEAVTLPKTATSGAAWNYCHSHIPEGQEFAVADCVAILTDVHGMPDYCAIQRQDNQNGDDSGALAASEKCGEQYVAQRTAADAQKRFSQLNLASGSSVEEQRLFKRRGLPCKRTTYTRGANTFEEFWFCIGDVQTESYTFLNGKLWSHFDAGRNP